MKTMLLLVLGLLSAAFTQAQNPVAFSVSPAQPQPGQAVHLTYNPAGTVLAGAKEITAVVYAYDENKPQVQEVPLTKGKKGWEGKFTPANGVDGAVVVFREEETQDNNKGNGYSFFLFDAKKQPVPGAASGLAAAYAEWGPMVEIDINAKKALELLQQEITRYPNRKKEIASTKLYALNRAYKDEELKAKIQAELDALALEPGLTPKELTLLANFYQRIENTEKAEIFAKMVRVQEPAGEFVQSERLNAYFEASDPDERAPLAIAFAKDFPEHHYVGRMLSPIAISYATEGKWDEFDAFLTKFPQVATHSTYNSAAWKLYESGEHLSKAKELAQKGYQLAQKEVNQPSTPKDGFITEADWKRNREFSLGQVADTYGAILLKENDPNARKYLAEAYQYTRGRTPSINERYAQFIALDTDQAKAQKILEEMVASGNSTPKVKGLLKEVYTKTNKDEAGFDAYWAKVEAPALDKMRADLKKKMISEKAPNFELVDLNGKKVSLASLKGKTVIVDFWATWCGPCIASFPGMQQAVDKYKDDSKVAFVFVNSWENGKDKKKTASDFMAKKNYTFQVLLDEENKMIEAYKVSGIPTKFVLDGNGNIRFKSMGYSGNNEKTVQEISMMIDLLKPEALTSSKR